VQGIGYRVEGFRLEGEVVDVGFRVNAARV
jgi:hypothetical protein